MLSENKTVFNKNSITAWHEAGYSGEGINLVEALGGSAEWDEVTRTGTFKLGDRTVILQDGSTKLVVK